MAKIKGSNTVFRIIPRSTWGKGGSASVRVTSSLVTQANIKERENKIATAKSKHALELRKLERDYLVTLRQIPRGSMEYVLALEQREAERKRLTDILNTNVDAYIRALVRLRTGDVRKK